MQPRASGPLITDHMKVKTLCRSTEQLVLTAIISEGINNFSYSNLAWFAIHLMDVTISLTSGNYGKTCLTEMNEQHEYLFGMFGAGSQKNRLFRSFPLPLCETESSWETIQMKMCFTSTSIIIYIKLIFIRKVVYENLFLNRGTQSLGNNLMRFKFQC